MGDGDDQYMTNILLFSLCLWQLRLVTSEVSITPDVLSDIYDLFKVSPDPGFDKSRQQKRHSD